MKDFKDGYSLDEIKCILHPNYRGIRKPTSQKEGCNCQLIYNKKHSHSKLPILPLKKGILNPQNINGQNC